MPVPHVYDAIIVGGGPAGLNAAIVLGRCRRKIIVFDSGAQRNKKAEGIHNYLTRDDILPEKFLTIARVELKKYGVPLKKSLIKTARKLDNGDFMVTSQNGQTFRGRKLLIATGLKDQMPAIKGFENFYGNSIFHCPYCDGWESRDLQIAVLSENRKGIELAMALKTWSDSVILFTNGNHYTSPVDMRLLKKYGIPVQKEKIMRLAGSKGSLRQIVLETGEAIPCDKMFFANDYSQQSDLAEELGCRLSNHNVIITKKSGHTSVPGLYVAGDASWDIHLVVIAAAEGAKAGVYINKQLQKEEREKIRSSKNHPGNSPTR